MKKLNEILGQIGLNKSNGLFYLKEDRWKSDTAFPNRVKRLIEKKIKPDAFFCFDNKPMVLFFENREDKEKLHKAIWNFNECPIAIFVDNNTIEIFNGFNYLTDKATLDKIGGSEKLNDFSYFGIVTGKTWEQYKEELDYKNRVDYHLLENIKSARTLLVEKHKLDAKVVNSIIGKSIFVRYLIDRGVKMRYDGTLRKWTNNEFCELLDSPRKIQDFFDYLEDTERGFNGDLFPLTANEYKHIKREDYQVIKRLLKGDNIEKNQPSLFEFYDFSIIPIEFISNVYELFIGQDNQEKEGAYYTPLFLVDYILKESVENHLSEISKRTVRLKELLINQSGKYPLCRVLDPACGSGIFLVETLRKIIEKYISETGIDPKEEKGRFKTAIKNLAKENIYGIDKDESAVQVAVFSIYLTLLDYLEPAAIEDAFKFPPLINTNFFNADFFNQESQFNNSLKGVGFDFILGNPPWEGKAIGKSGEKYLKERKAKEKPLNKKYSIAINNGEIAEGFMLRVSDFTNTSTKIALIIRSSILYNKGYSEFSKFRQYWLEEFFIDRVFELAPVRHEVFDRSNDPAIAPAAIIFYRYADGKPTGENVVEHLALKPSRFFSMFKIFTLNRADFKKVKQSQLKNFDWLWKVLVYGSYLDFNFIKRLWENYQTVNSLVSDTTKFKRGTGVQYSSNPDESSKHLVGLPFVDVFGIEPFFIHPQKISSFDKIKVGRRRDSELFKAPVLLTRIGLDTKHFTTKAAISYNDIVYKKSVTGIRPLTANGANILRNILGLINSSLYSYLAINTFGSIGIEREQTKEYEKFNIPYLNNGIFQFVKEIENIKSKIYTEQQKQLIDDFKLKNLQNQLTENLNKINSSIISQIDADDSEIQLIDFALNVSIPLVVGSDGNSSSNLFDSLIFEDKYLKDYASVFIKRFKSKLDNEKKKFIVEVWHTNQIIGMFFKMIPASEYKEPIIWKSKQNQDNEVLMELTKISSEKITDKLFVQKDIRGFEKEDFYIFKPNEKRLWHKAIGYLDVNEFADAILRKGAKAK